MWRTCLLKVKGRDPILTVSVAGAARKQLKQHLVALTYRAVRLVFLMIICVLIHNDEILYLNIFNTIHDDAPYYYIPLLLASSSCPRAWACFSLIAFVLSLLGFFRIHHPQSANREDRGAIELDSSSSVKGYGQLIVVRAQGETLWMRYGSKGVMGEWETALFDAIQGKSSSASDGGESGSSARGDGTRKM